MEFLSNKNKALSKKETKGLLSLIEKSTIITSRKTTGTSNRLKTQEWLRITDIFNETIGTYPRTPRQLRLKWENLKKNSRRRNALIRMEQMKTGDGTPRYFLPDEILDHVTMILESNRGGSQEIFGGDAEPQNVSDCSDEDRSRTSMSSLDTSLPVLTKKVIDKKVSASSIKDEMRANNCTPVDVPNKRHLRFSGIKLKRFNLADDGRYARNIALAEYYKTKKKLLECQYENMKIENEKIKLENAKLKLEIKKLSGDGS